MATKEVDWDTWAAVLKVEEKVKDLNEAIGKAMERGLVVEARVDAYRVEIKISKGPMVED